MFEDVSDNCLAAQSKGNRYLGASYPGQASQSVLDAESISNLTQWRFPGFPPQAACSAMYWYLVTDGILGGALTKHAFERR